MQNKSTVIFLVPIVIHPFLSGKHRDVGAIDGSCAVRKTHLLKSSYYFWNFAYGNHPWLLSWFPHNFYPLMFLFCIIYYGAGWAMTPFIVFLPQFFAIKSFAYYTFFIPVLKVNMDKICGLKNLIEVNKCILIRTGVA